MEPSKNDKELLERLKRDPGEFVRLLVVTNSLGSVPLTHYMDRYFEGCGPSDVQGPMKDGYDTATGFVAHSQVGGAPTDSHKGNKVPWFRGRSRW